MKFPKNTNKNKGFTIVELLISMSVLSVVLLIGVAVFVQIGRFYTKGVTTTRTQEAARSVLEEISRDIQFSSTSVVHVSSGNAYCIDKKRYSYTLHQQLQRNSGQALIVDTAPAGCVGPLASDRREMLSPGMRLNKFRISPVGSSKLWKVEVKVMHGENDLFEPDPPNVDTAQCKGSSIGTQFCAVSDLSTTVVRRL